MRATINGSPAPEGTRIVALVDGVEVDEAFVTSNDRSILQVLGNVGKTVTFRIGTLPARETFTVESGGIDPVNLTATR